jgi:hypothetical protein
VTRRPTDNLKTLWEGSGYFETDLNDFELSADRLASSRAGSLLQNSKIKIKRSQPSAAPTVGSRKTQKQVGCQAAFASRLAPTESKSSAAARGEAAPLNNERKLE